MRSSHRIRTRPPRGAHSRLALNTEPDAVGAYLEDAAHYPGGHAAGVALPASEAEVAAWLASDRLLLPVGARSSLTGGATPFGEVVLSLARLNRIVDIGSSHVRVQAGVPLTVLLDALAGRGLWFPPVPTFLGACVGGVIATNAAGAATFKYGPTRPWVQALTMALPGGEILDLDRGQTTVHPDGYFEIESAVRSIRVPVPRYRLPDVPKCSAGYYAAPDMDLIDLFIGSEGTLGVVVQATLRVIARPPATALALVPLRTETDAIALVARLRDAAATSPSERIQVASIEHLDARCLEVLRQDEALAKHDVTVPAGAGVLLLVQIELEMATTREAAWEQVSTALEPGTANDPLVRFCRLLADFDRDFDRDLDILSHTEMALPGDTRREQQLLAIREAVPSGVNRRIAIAQRTIDPAITKTAADMIVPFLRVPDMMAACHRLFTERGLDYAVWGHVSDGNVHPNVIPRSRDEMQRGRDAIMELGREVLRLGGSPLAEHGVGRNRVKQALAALMFGSHGIDEMRAVKRAIDPAGRLSPGVVFDP